jgi:hypothetical protein
MARLALSSPPISWIAFLAPINEEPFISGQIVHRLDGYKAVERRNSERTKVSAKHIDSCWLAEEEAGVR